MPSQPRRLRGFTLALAAAAISGFAVFINKFAVAGVSDAVVYTTVKNGLVALALVGLLLILKKWPEISRLSDTRKLQLLAVGAIGGSLPFILFFVGLKMTTAVNAAIIHKTLFVWVTLLAIPFLKEKMSSWQWLGAAAVFAAVLVGGGFKGFSYNLGELMILGATLLWAVENIIAKKALADVSPATLAAARMGIGSLILLPAALMWGDVAAVASMDATAWLWTSLAVGLLLAYVLTWYSALKFAPAGLVATLLVPAVLVTDLLNAVFVTRQASPNLVPAAALFLAGAALVVGCARKKPTAAATAA
jgi:drug/metabolite transporter (DMT)-like permease